MLINVEGVRVGINAGQYELATDGTRRKISALCGRSI